MTMKKVPKDKWVWFGNAGHFICGRWCRFHLTTKVGPWLVSTVGEYWPERSTREIMAEIEDGAWFAANKHLRGDYFDHAYMQRFGYAEIGCDRKYETMVFRAGKPCVAERCGCGLPEIDGHELDMDSYNDAKAATLGHRAMCAKWATLTKRDAAKL
jgi:hypothetical protein